MTVDGMYLRIIIHDNEHMGQLVAYARMNGIVPPWSKSIRSMTHTLKQIAILGSTGSIGQSTLSIIESIRSDSRWLRWLPGRNVDAGLRPVRALAAAGGLDGHRRAGGAACGAAKAGGHYRH